MKIKYRYVVLLFILILPAMGCPSMILRATGMRPFVEPRFSGWVAMGTDETELDQVLRRIHDPQGDGPGSWVYELCGAAAQHEQAAIRAEQAKQKDLMVKEYQRAALFYYIARFPCADTPAKEKAYQKHIQCYLKAAGHMAPPLEIVRIPYEGKEIIGYLRVPNTPRPPVVLVTGGVDMFKSDLELGIRPMLEQGLAVLAIDMPGTGESQWSLATESERVYHRVIEYLQTRPDLDGERLGVFGFSFGGYWAIRLALTRPEVKASVNVGGPIALSFTPEHMGKLPKIMAKTITHAMRLDGRLTDNEAAAKVRNFSLEYLLRNPKHRAALLSINGDRDNLVLVDDLYLISKLGVQQEEWVYKGDGHCAGKNFNDWSIKSAAWLKSKL